MESLWIFSILFAVINIILLQYYGLYHGIWRYASMHEILSIFKSIVISTLLIIALLFLIFRLQDIPRSFPILLFIVSLLGVTGPRVFYRVFKDKFAKKQSKIPVLVVGDNDTSENFIRLTRVEKNSPYNVVGIVGTKKSGIGRRIHNIPIVSTIEDLNHLEMNIRNYELQRIIISDHTINSKIVEALYILSKKNGLAIGILPKLSNFSLDPEAKFTANPIAIEDVLGRKQKVHNTSLLSNIKNRVVLITGAGGSIGGELARQVSSLHPKQIILLESNEYALYKISTEIKGPNICKLADIRDCAKVEEIISEYKPDIIFHAAALKHITFVEDEPLEALKTNYLATVKICELCNLYNVPKMVFISTDKAVNPTNVMGASKRLCEKYIQQISSSTSNTIFSIVRFGNVLGSTGSVVPLFEAQIKKGGPITITDPQVTRYFMTIREAVELVLISSQLTTDNNGGIFILEMGKSVLIKDLAKRMITLSGRTNDEIKIKYTGLRKGEKLYEELFFSEEKMIKTEINGILYTVEKLYKVDVGNYGNLSSFISKNNSDAAIKKFREMLPEYRNSEEN
ncbi:MAG: nucleoside-diphosphate sugar epimerase/dehydratase [Pseudomonadota bacterium]|nr:nucleoside-diphosphate sugar epimerase/dehydratase [Pseudomonadota bacterium]